VRLEHGPRCWESSSFGRRLKRSSTFWGKSASSQLRCPSPWYKILATRLCCILSHRWSQYVLQPTQKLCVVLDLTTHFHKTAATDTQWSLQFHSQRISLLNGSCYTKFRYEHEWTTSPNFLFRIFRNHEKWTLYFYTDDLSILRLELDYMTLITLILHLL